MPPLITNVNMHMFRSTTPSSHLQMPHVFVIPPEEEQPDNPPWCCFDADEHPENNPDFPPIDSIHFLDVSHPPEPPEKDAPGHIPQRTFIQHSRLKTSVSRKLEKKQHPEAVKIIEIGPSQTKQKDEQVDLDVIEVIKVKRTREAFVDLEENTRAKRSKTLRARATKALQSIKNVGKGSQRIHVKELWTSSESMPGIFKGVQRQACTRQDQEENHPPVPTLQKGSLSRSNSRSLSQIFQPNKPLRSESVFTVRAATPAALTESHHILPATNSLSLKYNDTNPSLVEVSDTITPDDIPSKPSLSTRKHVTTRFSIRELHRLFSFSPSPNNPSLSGSSLARLHSPSTHNDVTRPIPTSMVPSSHPFVSMGEDAHVDTHHLNLRPVGRKPVSRYRQELQTRHGDSGCRLSDFSFEMRLDSLHFDALSFDPEDFDVSMEGDSCGNT